MNAITELSGSPIEKLKIEEKKHRYLQSNINSMKNIASLTSVSPKLINLTDKLKNKLPLKGKMNSLLVSSTSREKIVNPAKINTRATNPNSLLSMSSLYIQKQNRNIILFNFKN